MIITISNTMKAILVSYEVFKEGELVKSDCSTYFSGCGYGKLFKRLLKQLRKDNPGCNVYAKSVMKL